MTLLFGNLSQDFVSFGNSLHGDPSDPAFAQQLAQAGADFRRSAARNATWLTVLGSYLFGSYIRALIISFEGIGIFASTYIFMHAWIYTGERNAKRIREQYFRAVLRQEVAFFDTVGAGEVTTRIENDTRERTWQFSTVSTHYLPSYDRSRATSHIREGTARG